MRALQAQGLFIDRNNNVYASIYPTGQIRIWRNGTSTDLNISAKYSAANSLFVSRTGDLYIDDSSTNAWIVKWSLDRLQSDIVAYIPAPCRGLFIDIANTIYCSLANINLIVKKSLNDNSTTPVVVAGTGCAGSTSTTLSDLPASLSMPNCAYMLLICGIIGSNFSSQDHSMGLHSLDVMAGTTSHWTDQSLLFWMVMIICSLSIRIIVELSRLARMEFDALLDVQESMDRRVINWIIRIRWVSIALAISTLPIYLINEFKNLIWPLTLVVSIQRYYQWRAMSSNRKDDFLWRLIE